jgi:hypothetical protein
MVLQFAILQYPNYAVDFRPCRTSTPVPVTYYRSYPPALHSLYTSGGGLDTRQDTRRTCLVTPDETHGDVSGTLGKESQPRPDARNKENRARLASTYRRRNMENIHVCNKVALSIRRRESRVSRSESGVAGRVRRPLT